MKSGSHYGRNLQTEHPIGTSKALADAYEQVSENFCAFVRNLSDCNNDQREAVKSVLDHVVEAASIYLVKLQSATGRVPDSDSAAIGEQSSLTSFEMVVNSSCNLLRGEIQKFGDAELSQMTVILGQTKYDVEQLIEHAIVHVLRHQNQIARISRRTSS
jgi:uncharacterized damage-inducible protein DinB